VVVQAAQDYLDHLSPAGREFVTWMGGMLALLPGT